MAVLHCSRISACGAELAATVMVLSSEPPQDANAVRQKRPAMMRERIFFMLFFSFEKYKRMNFYY
jgi:hypothetical protein